MRTLGSLFILPVPKQLRLRQDFSAVLADFEYSCATIEQHISSAVQIGKNRRVNSLFLQKNRFTVRALRPLGRSYHLHPLRQPALVQAVGGGNIKLSFIIRNIRCPVSSAALQPLQPCPVGIGDSMSYYRPMNQILGMGNRNAREKYKRGIYHIIILSHPHNRRIRMHPPADRVMV